MSLDDEWMNKMRTHTREYSSVLKRKEPLTRATTWTRLEDTMPGKVSQSGEDKYDGTDSTYTRSLE